MQPRARQVLDDPHEKPEENREALEEPGPAAARAEPVPAQLPDGRTSGHEADGADLAIGAEIVVRTAGFPAHLWTDGGNPDLFHTVDVHRRQHDELHARAHELAERISDEVIPEPELDKSHRRAALVVRRRLHCGDVPEPDELADLIGAPAVPARITADLLALACRAVDHRIAGDRAQRAAEHERARIGPLAWESVRNTSIAAAFLDTDAADLVAEIERRSAAGEAWTSKRLRHRVDYLWRIIARGAAKATPRSWLGHVGTLPMSDARQVLSAGDWRAPGVELGELTTETAENLHALRTRLDATDLRCAAVETPLALANLYTENGAEFRCFTLDQQDATRMREIRLRRTAALEALCRVLRDGVRPLGDVQRAFVGAEAAAEQVGKVREFLAYVHRLGVLRVCGAPQRNWGAWASPAEAASGGRAAHRAGADDAFVDVHRRIGTSESGSTSHSVREPSGVDAALRAAHRLARLREDDGTVGRVDLSGYLTEQPRPATEVLTDLLAADVDLSALRQRAYTGWHEPTGTSEAYGRVIERVHDRLSAEEVDVSESTLDGLGVPAGEEPVWPTDCLMRPVRGSRHDAVLVVEAPAGNLDARFGDAFARAHGEYRNAARYRRFLREVEHVSGARFVELLLPPSHERAANAVCRPVCTGLWTGDADRYPYHRAQDSDSAYLPLERVRVFRSGGGVRAESAGAPLLPVYHATRPPLPPYDLLLHLLLAAGPGRALHQTRLDRLITAFPDAPSAPRLTAGSVVLSPAAWRIPAERLWDAGASDWVKIRDAARLWRARDLPRWVFVSTESEGKAVPADLESLPGLRAVERVAARCGGDALLFEEMLPGPRHLFARDGAHAEHAHHAVEVALRLPREDSIRTLARRAGDRLRTDVPVPR
ncbi:lantibiotic dehydratase [Bounagaea algeriensis]